MIRSDDSWPRVIAHADMDAFYAAIEQLDNSSLAGRPILVGPRSERGVVLTASYEARPYGVGSAMPMAKARRLCPDAVVVPPRFDRYQEVSRTIMKVFSDFSPEVEALSLDEAFLDMSGSEQLLGNPETIGRRLKRAVREATGGLTASVGNLGDQVRRQGRQRPPEARWLDGGAAPRREGLACAPAGVASLGCRSEDRGKTAPSRSGHDRQRGHDRSKISRG